VPAANSSPESRAKAGDPYRITLLAGDGIGPEVTAQALAVLREALARTGGPLLEVREELVGGAAFDATGSPLPDATIAACLEADAVLLGAVGGPVWDTLAAELRPEAGLLALRKAMDLYANIRPVHCHPALVHASPLRPELVAGADFVVYRELGSGIYYGQPRRTEPLPHGGGERAVDTMSYTTAEVQRLARLGFAAAASGARGRRGLVTSIDKANVLDCSRLWRRVVSQLAVEEFPGVRLEHAYVDSAAMELVARPRHFDVIVTGNMFGDILSDLAACIAGSLGMLPSASLGGGGALYEPIHGSAPDIAGRDVANPLATILSAAMMCELSLDLPAAGAAIRAAVARALDEGFRTVDIAGHGEKGAAIQVVGTAAMGEAVRERLAE